MKNKLLVFGKISGGCVVVLGLIYGIFFWYPAHEIAVHLAEGWVAPTSWNCPEDHPIKANLKSMIYHMPGDPYWNRTNALNGECFDTAHNAERQGFRAILGQSNGLDSTVVIPPGGLDLTQKTQ